MSRTEDVALTERIIAAARVLWHRGGEKSLTLRAVAKAAKTTTPSVYQRFATKEDLVLALARRYQQEWSREIMSSPSLGAGAELLLDMVQKLPHEYIFFFGTHWGTLFERGKPRPAFDWAKVQLAKRHGGSAEQYHSHAWAILLLLHGASQLLSTQPPPALAEEVRENCLRACAAVVSHPELVGKATAHSKPRASRKPRHR